MTEKAGRGTLGGRSQPPSLFRDVLAKRNFALLWSGQSLSSVGNQVFPVALAFLVLQQHGSDLRLGVVLGTQSLAVLVGLFAAAAVGDRWRRTRMMITADTLRALTIAIIALRGTQIGVAALLALVAVEGIGEGLFQPAFGAVVPRVRPVVTFSQETAWWDSPPSCRRCSVRRRGCADRVARNRRCAVAG